MTRADLDRAAPSRAADGVSAPASRVARTLREALVVGLPALLTLPVPPPQDPFQAVLRALAAVLVVPVLLLRRRAPMPVVVALAGLMGVGLDVQWAVPVALASAAARAPRQRVVPAALLLLGAYTLHLLLGRFASASAAEWLAGDWIPVAVAALVLAASVTVGLYAGARRQLLVSMRERAERAEAEQQLLADRARVRERALIAREMHDVLAHRLSMLALHAGALEYRADDAELTGAAGVVRENAHQALQELRDVLSVLRADTATDGEPSTDAVLQPQPALADVPRLIAEAEQGAQVVSTLDGPLDAVPAGVGRAAYRIVQEALTNARRHAPGSAVAVRVSATPGAVVVEVRNAAPAAGRVTARLAGRGSGLVGIAERAALLGGLVEHGPTDDDGWALRAELPIPADEAAPSTPAPALEPLTTVPSGGAG